MRSLISAGWLCIMILAGCRGLKDSEAATVQEFAKATYGVSKVPADIYSRKYRIEAEAVALQTSAMISGSANSRLAIDDLKRDYREKALALQTAREFSAAYHILERYSELLMALTSKAYLKDFSAHRSDWQRSFDNAVRKYNSTAERKIPATAGALFSNIITSIGDKGLEHLQRKYLKEAIAEGTPVIAAICNSYCSFDSSKLLHDFDRVSRLIDDNFIAFLDTEKAYEDSIGNNSYNYYKFYSPVYLDWLSEMEQLKALHGASTNGFRQMALAMQVLNGYLSNHSSYAECSKASRKLYNAYLDIEEIYERFGEERLKNPNR